MPLAAVPHSDVHARALCDPANGKHVFGFNKSLVSCSCMGLCNTRDIPVVSLSCITDLCLQHAEVHNIHVRLPCAFSTMNAA